MLYTTNNTISIYNEIIKEMRENVSLIANSDFSKWDYGHYLILEEVISDIILFRDTFKDEITTNERLSLLFIEKQATLTRIRFENFLKDNLIEREIFNASKEEYKDVFVF